MATAAAMRTIEFTGIEFATDGEAVEYAEAGGGCAVSVAGGSFVLARAEAQRLEARGVEMAYLFEVQGRIMTVPVN